MIPEGQAYVSVYTVEFLKSPGRELDRCQSIEYSLCQTVSLLTQVLTGKFFPLFLYTIDGQQSNVYFAIMTLWHVEFLGFLIISSVFRIVNDMCLVIPAAAV
jgi:hypothetical protein